MQVSKIQVAVRKYAEWLEDQQVHPEAFWWETVQVFQREWNTDTDDIGAMYDRSIDNSVTRRPWQSERWFPKRMMRSFLALDSLTTKQMFEELFDESKNIESRINHFLFGCDALLEDYRNSHPTAIENNHYHGDYRMIGLYLALRYPDQYGPYAFEGFQQSLQFFQAKDPPRQDDLVRYNRMLKTIQTFMDKEPRIQKSLEKLLSDDRYFKGKSLLAAADLCRRLRDLV
jgi:hypothetical protein